MGSSEKSRFLSWIEEKGNLQSVLTIPNLSDGIRSVIDDKEQYAYDDRTSSARLCVQVQGTQYEGRSPRIESIRKGNPLKLRREPDNPFNANNIAVQNKAGQSLGNLPADLANLLAPLLDSGEAELHNIQAGFVEPLSKRSSKAKKALLYVAFTVKLKKTDYSKLAGCTVCLLGGEQGSEFLRKMQQFAGNTPHRIWVQELQVLHCKMPVAQAKLIFELYNRYHREYDEENNETGYFGLDNLEEEVACAREKMRKEKQPGLSYDAPKDNDISLPDFIQAQIQKEPQRYGSVKAYFADAENTSHLLETIFKADSLGQETYHWLDQTPVTDAEFQEVAAQGCFNHWYDVAELFPAEGLPVDLNDEDVVSIFGTGKFLAFADLSYGC